MEGQNKHFSHNHSLNLHQLPRGTEIPCSGCNSSGAATVYVCWQCNFFLHEQCYRASRSLKHPSHPAHPLTLVPYPTYPSNSFYCNSCKQKGTGFSYCCSNCEFDLHVQCAYNISLSTLLTPQTHIDPHQNSALPNQTPSFIPHQSIPNHSVNHQTFPNFKAQHAYIPHQTVTHQPIPNDQTSSFFSPQNAYMPHQISSHQYVPNNPIPGPSPSQEPVSSFNTQHPSMPDQKPANQSILDNHVLNYPAINETAPNFNVPQTPHIPQHIPSSHVPNYPTINETVPSFNAPQSSHIPQQYPTIDETIPSSSAPQNPHILQADTYEPINHNVPNPKFSPKPETLPNLYATTGISTTQSVPVADPLAQVKQRGVTHFSHPHVLCLIDIIAGKDPIACSACEDIISDSGYSCPKLGCNFHLDQSCFKLAKEIQHKSHPEHPLTLIPSSSDEYGQFICMACYTDCAGFTYHCSACAFDLHVNCASSPETVMRKDHEHSLTLTYSCPIKEQEYTFFCDVCHGVVQEHCWTYYCKKCDYGTHVDCINCEASPVVESSSSTVDPVVESSSSSVDSVLDAQLQMQRLQLQMEMARQSAQMMSSMGQSLANLAG